MANGFHGNLPSKARSTGGEGPNASPKGPAPSAEMPTRPTPWPTLSPGPAVTWPKLPETRRIPTKGGTFEL